jgi:hypothetical protein
MVRRREFQHHLRLVWGFGADEDADTGVGISHVVKLGEGEGVGVRPGWRVTAEDPEEGEGPDVVVNRL